MCVSYTIQHRNKLQRWKGVAPLPWGARDICPCLSALTDSAPTDSWLSIHSTLPALQPTFMVARVLQLVTPSPIHRGTGIVFDRFLCIFVCLFVYISVSLLARLRENGWTDLHETFREGVEWPWDDVIQFLVNSEKLRDAAISNTETGLVVLSHNSLF